MKTLFNTMILLFFSFLVSLIFTLFLGKIIVPVLRKFKIKQTIREVGPSWHRTKQGTPTMGGVIFIIGIILTVLIFVPIYCLLYKNEANIDHFIVDLYNLKLNILKILCGILMAISFGAIGFWDDYIKVTKRQNLGLTAKQKLALQFFVAFMYLFFKSFIEFCYGQSKITVVNSLILGEIDLGVFYFIICAVFIVGTVNAVNLTDGIDGLNISVTFVDSTFLLLFSFMLCHLEIISILVSALAGACVGFFVWNRNPAKVFMGDTGSLFLGGLLCAIVFTINMPILLIVIGATYYIEMFSVILQVLYFKITKGKRLFKMAPIHHHFELLKWSEKKICTVFSLFTFVCGMLPVTLVMIAWYLFLYHRV